jgi:L-ascorbate metabolism protein UlaG (beta-lactamase superfamily)
MSKTAVTRVTHSCHLIEIGGRTFLTDPSSRSIPTRPRSTRT